MATFLEMFEAELKKYNLKWCKGECGRNGHKRGFVMSDDRTTVHYDSKICTRATLQGGLHEIGHCVNDEKGLKRWEQEEQAEKFANDKMKELGVSVPRKTKLRGIDYVRRKKRHGENIIKGLRRNRN